MAVEHDGDEPVAVHDQPEARRSRRCSRKIRRSAASTTVLQSIQSLVLSAGDGPLNDADRGSLATQLQGYRSTLTTLANTTDANGNYIFAGFQGGSKPFSDNASGVGATYDGGPGQRQVQISRHPHDQRSRTRVPRYSKAFRRTKVRRFRRDRPPIRVRARSVRSA